LTRLLAVYNSALPTVDFPTISVTATLPGASPDSMASSVATPLIKEFSTIPSIATISATNYQGFTSITVEFDLNRNIDQAAADIQAAITRTLRRLPVELTIPPSFRKLNPADPPVIMRDTVHCLVEACAVWRKRCFSDSPLSPRVQMMLKNGSTGWQSSARTGHRMRSFATCCHKAPKG
jgi:hypothetical protein